ncbi:peptidylprolyl isomerase [Roseiflexus sp. AH-315-K22]|nr:peptidylprolyl isomerase [Roseiflexus sp. AH-315-K22]
MKTKDTPRAMSTFETLDRLEPRVLLDGSAMPDLGLMENPDNTIVRIVTDLGDVDIELFDADAPLATAQFLTQVQAGDFGQTFIHYADDNVLGAGLYRINDKGELNRRVATTQIDTTFVRSNVAQTFAMPLLDPLTGESNGSFIINLQDNAATADGKNIVFARVVHGWESIEAIAAQPREDLGAVFTEVPLAKWLTSAPVTEANPTPASIADAPVLGVKMASIIKGAGSDQFFTNRIYYPEGFSWEQIYEALDLMNPGEESLDYQVVVRYENGQRDQTIATGTLGAGQLDTLVVSERGEPSTLVRNSEPYAYEVWSTAPMAASVEREDFGGLGGDAFFNDEAFAGTSDLTEWAFSQVVVDASEANSFLVWQNTADVTTNLTVTFYYEDQESTSRQITLGANRRGGFELDSLTEINPGTAIGITISSDQPIVAGLSQYYIGDESKGHSEYKNHSKNKHGEYKSHGEKKEHGEHKSHGEKHGEKESHGEKKKHGEKKSHGEKGEHGEKKEKGEKGEHGEKEKHGEKENHREKKEHGEKGEHGEKKEHKKHGENKHGEYKEHGEHKKYSKNKHGKHNKHQENPRSAVLALGTAGGGALSAISSEIDEEKGLGLAILNPSNEDVTITFTITDEDGKTKTVELVMPADRLTLLDGKNSPIHELKDHEEFVIRYEANTPLTVGFTSEKSRATGTPFSSWASQVTYFADPNVYTGEKTSYKDREVWIYNPGNTDVTPTITLNFAELDPITVTLKTIEPGEWVIQKIEKLKKFSEKKGESHKEHFPKLKNIAYSLTVEGQTPLVVQTAQHERSASVENGLPAGPISLLTTPEP